LVAFRPGHAQLSVGAVESSRELELLDIGTGEIESVVVLPGPSLGYCWSRAGDRLVLGRTDDFGIAVNERGTFDSWTTLSGHQNFSPDLYFDPGGGLVLSSCWDSTSRVWDLITQQCVLVAPTNFVWPASSERTLLRIDDLGPGVKQFHGYE